MSEANEVSLALMACCMVCYLTWCGYDLLRRVWLRHRWEVRRVAAHEIGHLVTALRTPDHWCTRRRPDGAYLYGRKESDVGGWTVCEPTTPDIEAKLNDYPDTRDPREWEWRATVRAWLLWEKLVIDLAGHAGEDRGWPYMKDRWNDGRIAPGSDLAKAFTRAEMILRIAKVFPACGTPPWHGSDEPLHPILSDATKNWSEPIRAILAPAYWRAVEIIEAEGENFTKATQKLIRHGSLSATDAEEILGEKAPKLMSLTQKPFLTIIHGSKRHLSGTVELDFELIAVPLPDRQAAKRERRREKRKNKKRSWRARAHA